MLRAGGDVLLAGGDGLNFVSVSGQILWNRLGRALRFLLSGLLGWVEEFVLIVKCHVVKGEDAGSLEHINSLRGQVLLHPVLDAEDLEDGRAIIEKALALWHKTAHVMLPHRVGGVS